VLTTVTGDGLLSPFLITREPVITTDVTGAGVEAASAAAVSGVGAAADWAAPALSLWAVAGPAMASTPAPQTSRSCSLLTLSPRVVFDACCVATGRPLDLVL
jgi:hypothetical protein